MTNTLNKRMKNVPLFEYVCDTCKQSVNRIVKYENRKIVTLCQYTQCNGNLHFVDKIHSGSFNLKGKDWYKAGHS